MKQATPRGSVMAFALLVIIAALLAGVACGGEDVAAIPNTTESTKTTVSENLSGTVKIDGSSTVFPITEAVAEEFQRAHKDVRVTVGISGTGGGFKKFCLGETDITDASRPVKAAELELCAGNGVGVIEVPVAFDGLSVMVHLENDFVDYLTVDELEMIWKAGSSVEMWSDIRPAWPSVEIQLVGADTDSGTFDYFTETVLGEEGASRADYTASADDNVLVAAIADSRFALGYFGFAYYIENSDKLKLVPIDPGDGNSVIASTVTINDGSYRPLSRPLFIYVNKNSLNKPEVKAFVDFFLSQDNGISLISEVGYVPLPEDAYQLIRTRLHRGLEGSLFSEGSHGGLTIQDILSEGMLGSGD